jgi:hypothetical protein
MPDNLPVGMLTFVIADVRGYTAYTHRRRRSSGASVAQARVRPIGSGAE